MEISTGKWDTLLNRKEIRMIDFIDGITPHLTEIGDFDFPNIQFLNGFHNYINNDENIFEALFDIRCIGGNVPGELRGEICLRFAGVERIYINIAGKLPLFLPGFIIDNISQRGYEELYYRVMDYEEDVLSFYCRKIEFVSYKSFM